MGSLRRIVLRIVNAIRPGRAEPDLSRELASHLALLEDEFQRRGMSPEHARLAARRAFGGVEQTKDRHRDARSFVSLHEMRRDVRYALRTLRRSPGFSAVVILTLALGIGATTAIFSLLDAVILRDLPVSHPEALVVVKAGGTYPAFLAFRRQSDVFANLCATSGITRLDVEAHDGQHERTDVSLVSGSYFATLGVPAALGRTFTIADDRVPGAHPVAVASNAYFQRQFGGDVAALNRTIRVSGTPITIIGVAPPGFQGEHVGEAPDLWIPLTMWARIVPGRNLLESPGTAWLEMMGRVRPGLATSGVQPKLTVLFRQVMTDVFGPAAPADVRRDLADAVVSFEPAATGLSSPLRARFGRPLQLLMGAVVLVLLIACANIANLLLARAAARRREIEIRLALGASRARLLRQLLTESLMLAALGGAAGLLFARIARDALGRLISADGSRLPISLPTDSRLLLVVATLSIASAILFGLAPAWQSTRQRHVTSLLGRNTTGTAGPPTRRLSAGLVVGQMAISLVLLTGAGLLLRTVANLRGVDFGFDPQHLLIVDINPQAAGYSGARALSLDRRLLDRIKAVPGVSSVSLSENGVLMGRDSRTNVMHPAGLVAGPAGFPAMHFDWVGPGYFSTMGIALVSGRDFTIRDRVGSTAVVAINKEAARFFFAGASPIGTQLVWGDEGREPQALDIVAVTDDIKESGPRDEPQLRFYLPYFQMPHVRSGWRPASTRLLVRTALDPDAVTAPLRQAIASEDPRLSIDSVNLGADLVRRSHVQERMVAILLVAFGLLALGLASMGLYGLIAYQVARRASEIGIRMALGARRADVLWAMLRGGVAWMAAGTAIGVPVALVASRVAQGLLFGVSVTDPSTLIGAAGVLSAVGVLAGYIPARRALRIDPAIPLRSE